MSLRCSVCQALPYSKGTHGHPLRRRCWSKLESGFLSQTNLLVLILLLFRSDCMKHSILLSPAPSFGHKALSNWMLLSFHWLRGVPKHVIWLHGGDMLRVSIFLRRAGQQLHILCIKTRYFVCGRCPKQYTREKTQKTQKYVLTPQMQGPQGDNRNTWDAPVLRDTGRLFLFTCYEYM